MKPLILLLLLCSIMSCKQSPRRIQNKVMALLPYNGADTALVPFITYEIEQFYHCKVMLLPSRALPTAAWYSPRQRYKADSLLVYQQQLATPGVVTTIGFTASDISTVNGPIADWGVFGLGYCPGNACVISTWRLRSSTLNQLKERVAKVVLHEVGHNIGLPHCTANDTCLMNDAKGTMAQVDKERKWLCPHCRSLLAK